MTPISDAEIEAVARALCAGEGLDPDQEVYGSVLDGLTPGERAARYPTAAPHLRMPMPRWRTFRGRAQKEIAAHRGRSSD
jgi:hypothetical protein